MAKSRATKAARPADESAEQGEQQGQQFAPFLKADHLGRGPQKIQLTGWVRKIKGRFGVQFVVECQHDGTTYDFAFKPGTPNHRAFFMGLGNDETQWKGSAVVEVQRGKFGPFIAVLSVDPDDVPF